MFYNAPERIIPFYYKFGLIFVDKFWWGKKHEKSAVEVVNKQAC